MTTNSNKLQELIESVEKRLDQFYKEDKTNIVAYVVKSFIHQVILDTVEVVGNQIIGEDKIDDRNEDDDEYAYARNKLRKEQRARLSQLMDSLKEEHK